jgi:hypothetical protein
MLLAVFSCNNKEPLDALPNIGGYVIGREICTSDPQNDYWIIDFTAYADAPQIGDTLLLDGISYTNVLKVHGLHKNLQNIGMAVFIEYNKVSTGKVVTTGCTVANPVTYELKEIFIINQGEIR